MFRISTATPTWLRVLTCALCTLVFVGVLWNVGYSGLDIGRGAWDDFVSDWVYNVTLVLAAAIPIARALETRANWSVSLLLSLAILVWALGDIYWTVALENDENPPYPSLADAGFLLYYIPAYVALVLLVRRRMARLLPSVWLDGLVAVLGVAALAAAFVIAPILKEVGGSLAAVATNAAYPLADLLLVLFVIGAFALSGWRADRQLLLLGAGFITFAVADTEYLYRIASGTYQVGTFFDSLWLVGLALIAASTLVRAPAPRQFRYEGWSVLVVPSLLALASAGLLLYGGIRPVPLAGLLCAAGALLASFVRTILTFRDIRALADARREALTDELTGLPNRRSFYRELGQVAGGRKGGSVALLMIDLDGFKELNDTLGHQTGDVVLKMVGERLGRAVDGFGKLARVGGDEFAVLLPTATEAEECAQRVQEGLVRGFPVAGMSLTIGASIGIALYPEHADDAASLLPRADIAMYAAKRKHQPYAFYSADEDRFSLDRLGLTSELRQAILAGRLSVFYQPKIAIPSRDVAGVEALARWHHWSRGSISPADFIPLAEQAGLIRDLTDYVLRSALRQCRSWRAKGLVLPVSVNISATDLIDSNFRSTVEELLREENVPAGLLQLEITESVLMADPSKALDAVDQLSELGVTISLDDFGTGYSSLQYLSDLPVHELKIDRSFIRDISHPRNAEIVRCAVQLGKGLELNVVAEGVEDERVLEELVRFGCDAVQGYYFAAPLPADELEAWVRARQSARPQSRLLHALRPHLA